MADNSQDEYQEWFDGLLSSDHLIVMQRACIDLGWSHTLTDTGIAIDGDYETEEFLGAMHKRYVQMYNTELIEVLVEEGKVCATVVHKDGRVGYELANGASR